MAGFDPISAGLNAVTGIVGLFKKDPAVKVAEINADVSKYGIDASKEMNKDNNKTSIKLARITQETSAMGFERADLSERRWLDFSYDMSAASSFGCHGYGSGYAGYGGYFPGCF